MRLGQRAANGQHIHPRQWPHHQQSEQHRRQKQPLRLILHRGPFGLKGVGLFLQLHLQSAQGLLGGQQVLVGHIRRFQGFFHTHIRVGLQTLHQWAKAIDIGLHRLAQFFKIGFLAGLHGLADLLHLSLHGLHVCLPLAVGIVQIGTAREGDEHLFFFQLQRIQFALHLLQLLVLLPGHLNKVLVQVINAQHAPHANATEQT